MDLLFFSGKIKEDTKVIGVFYSLGFYSHFDGHLSEGVDFYESGANEISKEDFNTLKSVIEKYKEQGHDKSGELLEELMETTFDAPEDFWGARNFFKHFTIVDDNTINWDYKGNSDQSELHDGSYINFEMSTKSEIKSIKSVNTRYD